jgi:hypothetical protein
MMFPFNTPYNYLLNWAIVCFAIPWFYSYFNEQHRLSTMPVEQVLFFKFINLIIIILLEFILGNAKSMGKFYCSTFNKIS